MTVDNLNTDTALVEFLKRTGDNTLILSHRISEWCGHSPALEEDIAMANVALDLIGQTQFWLEFAAELGNSSKYKTADDLAYLRDTPEMKNVLLVELPNKDYGQTLMRQFLFDAWHFLLLKGLMNSSNRRIAEIAGKAIKEVDYHLERSSDLVLRLGDGTDLSHKKMQEALDNLWNYTGELFIIDEVEEILAQEGIIPDLNSLKGSWNELVRGVLKDATLKIPENNYVHQGGKTGWRHTEHLGYILTEMQFLQRAYPGCKW